MNYHFAPVIQNSDISGNLAPASLAARDLFLIFFLDSCLALFFLKELSGMFSDVGN